MKRIYTILMSILLSVSIFAQSPEKMSYQAVIRDASNNLAINQAIGMQVSIIQGSVFGSSVYVETQITTSNANGLVNIEIGTGTVLNGRFSTIDWANGPYFIKTETDPSGGMNFTITGTSQLLSVPYALHAKTVETIVETDPIFGVSQAKNISESDITNLNNLSGVNSGDQDLSSLASKNNVLELGNTSSYTPDADYEPATKKYVDDLQPAHYVGELYMGGIVFYTYNNGQNGLVASLKDLDGGAGVQWSDVLTSEIGTEAQSYYDGEANTDAIIAQQMSTSAAQLCRDLGVEWYLPANWELNLLYNSAFIISKILENDGNAETEGFIPEPSSGGDYGYYWSSTEIANNAANYIIFGFNRWDDNGKYGTYRVRAVRAF